MTNLLNVINKFSCVLTHNVKPVQLTFTSFQRCLKICFVHILPVILDGSEEDDLGKGNQLAEDEPDVDHLDVGRRWQHLHLPDEDGRRHQHYCQVCREGGLKEDWLEVGGGKGDQDEKDGW